MSVAKFSACAGVNVMSASENCAGLIFYFRFTGFDVVPYGNIYSKLLYLSS